METKNTRNMLIGTFTVGFVAIAAINYIISNKYDVEKKAQTTCTQTLADISKFDYIFDKGMFNKKWNKQKIGDNYVQYVANLKTETNVVGVVIRNSAVCRHYHFEGVTDVVMTIDRSNLKKGI